MSGLSGIGDFLAGIPIVGGILKQLWDIFFGVLEQILGFLPFFSA